MKTQQSLTRPAVAMLVTLFGAVASLSSHTAWAHGDSHKGLEDEWYMNIESVEDLESDHHEHTESKSAAKGASGDHHSHAQHSEQTHHQNHKPDGSGNPSSEEPQ